MKKFEFKNSYCLLDARIFMFLTLISLILLLSALGFAFDKSFLSSLLAEEIKKFASNKEVQVGQIKFIGLALPASSQENAMHFEPKGNCIPENLKIREIKRPNFVEFTFNCGTRQYRALANYEILSTVYISQKKLQRGQTIEQGDILQIKIPASRVPAGAIIDKDEVIGKVIRRTIAQGLIIKGEHIYPNIPVKRGSRVNITIISGQVTIMTEGVLKYDATVGSNVRVVCEQTGKEIAGILVDKDKVRVTL
jgi:flagella basal body P-ring formation protein FlgA